MAAAPLFVAGHICSLCPRRRKCRGPAQCNSAVVFALLASVVYLGLSSPALAQRSDRAIISGVVTDPQGAAVPGATVTIHNVATGVDTVLVTNDAGAYTSPPLVLGTYKVKVELQGFSVVESGDIAPQGGEQVRHDVTMAVGNLSETVQVQGRTGIDVTTPEVAHTRRSEVLRGPPIRHRRRRAPRRVGAAHAARLPAHAAQRRPDVPRQPVQLPHQRRAGDGDRELLRRRGLRVRERPPAESRERAAGRVHPGNEGHLDDLLGPVRPHQRRVHRVHEQVGHERLPRQRLLLHGQRQVQREHHLRGGERHREDADLEQQSRVHLRRPAGAPRLQRPEQDVLLHEHRLHADPLGHGGRLRQHHADRRVQERGLQLAADRAADRHGRASAGRSSAARSTTRRRHAWSTAYRSAIRSRTTRSRRATRC